MKKNNYKEQANLFPKEFNDLLLEFVNSIFPSKKELDILLDHLDKNNLTTYDVLLLNQIDVLYMLMNYNRENKKEI